MNNETSISKCKLCGANAFSHLLQKNNINIVRCNNCSLVFADFDLNNNTANQFSRNFYVDDYFTGYRKKEHGGEFGYQKDYFTEKRTEKVKIAHQNLIQIERLVQNKGVLLDVGCAAGFFLNVAKEGGWHTQGLEISEFAANYAKTEFHLEVEIATLDNTTLKNESFDVITAWDVIEHVPDPHQFLMSINRLLKPGGIFIAGTPNADSWSAKLKGKSWCHYNPPEHLFNFEPITLNAFAESLFYKTEVHVEKAPYSQVQMKIQSIIKRLFFIVFNNISASVNKGEYLKLFAWKESEGTSI